MLLGFCLTHLFAEAMPLLTPGRLLLLFCAMNMLEYIDRGEHGLNLSAERWHCPSKQNGSMPAGIIASNGVNGDKAVEGRASYGIVVCRML